MSGYIVRNQLMTDIPWGGTASPSSMLPTALPNPLATASPMDAWGAPMQSGTGGPTLAIPAGTGPNDDLAKLLAQFYGTPGQAQPQAPTPQQQLQQAITADQANYHGREGGGIV